MRPIIKWKNKMIKKKYVHWSYVKKDKRKKEVKVFILLVNVLLYLYTKFQKLKKYDEIKTR